jgi:ABC-type amino acid transport system permease subunit
MQSIADVKNNEAQNDAESILLLKNMGALMRSGFGRFFFDVFSMIYLLAKMEWISLMACISTFTVSQSRNNSYQLLLYGYAWGMMFALLSQWHLLYAPVFALLAGVLNSQFPYSVYMHEITRFTEHAYRV